MIETRQELLAEARRVGAGRTETARAALGLTLMLEVEDPGMSPSLRLGARMLTERADALTQEMLTRGAVRPALSAPARPTLRGRLRAADAWLDRTGVGDLLGGICVFVFAAGLFVIAGALQ